MNLPDIIHHTGYVALPNLLLDTLRDDLDWERRSDAPRGEYYANDSGAPYTYGRGRGVRTYLSKSWHPYMLSLRVGLEKYLSTGPLDACFLNRYENERDHLGWHADDSPEMDHARPIAVISLGAERDLEFRPKGGTQAVHRVHLTSGSLLVMPAGRSACTPCSISLRAGRRLLSLSPFKKD